MSKVVWKVWDDKYRGITIWQIDEIMERLWINVLRKIILAMKIMVQALSNTHILSISRLVWGGNQAIIFSIHTH